MKSHSSAKNKIDLSVYVSTKSNWDKKEIKSRLTEANKILLSCGLSIHNVYVHDWIPSSKLLRVDEYASHKKYYDGLRYAAQKSKQLTTIDLFYFDDYLESFSSGPSLPLSVYPNPKIETVSFNTAWFPYKSAQRRLYGKSLYSEEAHEVGHILLQSGHDHSGDTNIMANDSGRRTTQYSKSQCEIIKKHPAIIKNFKEKAFPLFSTYYQNYSKDYYMNDWCSRNVSNLGHAFVKNINLTNNRVISVFVRHKDDTESIHPIRARGGKVSWRFHTFLLIDHLVFDLDYSKKPQVLPLKEYLKKMFGDEVKNYSFLIRDPLDRSVVTNLEVIESFKSESAKVINWQSLIDLAYTLIE